MNKQKSKLGFGALEIVIGSAIISSVFLGLFTVASSALRSLNMNQSETKAVFLIEEGVEAVKILRDNSWTNISNLTAGTNYYYNFNGTTWESTLTNTFVDSKFERKFVLADVYRDANDDIVTSGGALDTGTTKLTVTVSWPSRGTTVTKSVSTYITNLFE